MVTSIVLIHAFAALFAATPPAAQASLPDVITPDALGANFDPDAPGKGTPADYDFLVGSWTFRFQQRLDGGGYRPPQQGTWEVRKDHGGAVVADVWTLGRTTNPTITYRIFNPSRGLWELQGTKRETGGWDPAISWSRGDERFLVQRFNQGRLLARIRYYAITADGFRWRADGSLDNGKTWMLDLWKMEARRAR